MSKVIRIDQSDIRSHLDKMVLGAAEETLKQAQGNVAQFTGAAQVPPGFAGPLLVLASGNAGKLKELSSMLTAQMKNEFRS